MKLRDASFAFFVGMALLTCKAQENVSKVAEDIQTITLVSIDSVNFYKSFYILRFFGFSVNKVIIFSEKKEELSPLLEYEKLFVGNTYRLDLIPLKSTSVIIEDVNFRLPSASDIYIDDKLLFPKDSRMYLSDDLIGLYKIIRR
jgi:hypothetical protein